MSLLTTSGTSEANPLLRSALNGVLSQLEEEQVEIGMITKQHNGDEGLGLDVGSERGCLQQIGRGDGLSDGDVQ